MERESLKKIVHTLEYVSECMVVGCEALKGVVDNDQKVIEQPKIQQTFEENFGRVGKNIYEYIRSLYHRGEQK